MANLVFRQKVLMALPPLELFSLKEKPPCCRAAFPRLMVDFDDCWIASDRVMNDERDSGDMIVPDCECYFFAAAVGEVD